MNMMARIIGLGIAAAVGAWLVLIFNRLVTLRNRVRQLFAGIDTQLKRRRDLIPNMVAVAQGYMQHERGTLEAVAQARGQAVAAAGRAGAAPADALAVGTLAVGTLAGAESALGGALYRLLAVVERYPELKADETMLRLMEELRTTENRIAFARQAYNDAVMEYNTVAASFPALLAAKLLGFAEAKLFEIADPNERAVVDVKF